MDHVIKQRWLEALRSGKYTQTVSSLRNEHGFCCLGVLCDIYDSERWVKSDDGDTYGYVTKIDRHGSNFIKNVLPEEVYKHAGLFSDNPSVFIDGTRMKQLATINDGGASFEEIADIIETHL